MIVLGLLLSVASALPYLGLFAGEEKDGAGPGKGGDGTCTLEMDTTGPLCLNGSATVTVRITCNQKQIDDCDVTLSSADHVVFKKDGSEQDTVTISSCGEMKEVKVETTKTTLPEKEKGRTVTIDAESACGCGSTSADVELKTCEVDIKNDGENSGNTFCPGDTATLSGSYTCKLDDCEKDFDWSVTSGSQYVEITSDKEGKKSVDIKVPDDVSFSESKSHSARIEAVPNGCSSDCTTGTYDLTIEPCSVEIKADNTELCPTKTTKLDGSYNCQEPPEECSSGFNWEIKGKNEEAPIKLVGGTDGKESVTVEAKQETKPGETATVKAKPSGCSNCEEDTKQISIKEFGTEVSVTGDKKICAGATTKLKAELTKCEEACDKGFAWTVKEGPARVKPQQDSSDKATLKMNKDAEKGETATVVAKPKCEALSDVKDSAEVSVKPCEIELTSGADGTDLCPGDEFTVEGETNCEHDVCTPNINFLPSGPVSEEEDKQNKAKYEVSEEAEHKANVSIDAELNCAKNCEVKKKIEATVKHKCKLDRLTVNRRELCKGDTATFTADTSSPCKDSNCKAEFEVNGAGKKESEGNRSVTVEATRDRGSITVEATAKNCSESDGGCSDSRSIPIGGSGAGGYALEKPDTQYSGTSPEGPQFAVRSFELDNATSFVTSDEANVYGVWLKKMKVSVERKKVALDKESERMFHTFPWLRGDDSAPEKPVITGVVVEGHYKEDYTEDRGWKEDYFKNVNLDNRKQEVTIDKDILITDEVLNTEDLYDEVGVHIESPGTAVEVTIKPEVKVYFEGKCGNDREYSSDASATGTLKYEGLTIEKMPNYVFGDADYWMPIRVRLPQKLRGRHFVERSDEYANEIGVEEVTVQLKHRSDRDSEPKNELTARFEKQDGIDTNSDFIDEEEFGASDPFNTVRWVLGNGMTSGGSFLPEKNDYTVQGDNFGAKLRIMTVFVNLKKLMKKKLGGPIAETENDNPIHLFNKNKGLPIPRFQVEVELSAEDGFSTSFTSLVADDGRPKLLANHKIGPVLEPGEPTDQNHVKISYENKYAEHIFKQEAALRHRESNNYDKEDYDAGALPHDAIDVNRNPEEFSEKTLLDDDGDLVSGNGPVEAKKETWEYGPCFPCDEIVEIQAYSWARFAESDITSNEFEDGNLPSFRGNINQMIDVRIESFDRDILEDTGERVELSAVSRIGALFYISYGQNKTTDFESMNLDKDQVDIQIANPNPFPEGKLATGANILSEQVLSDTVITITGFALTAAGAVLTAGSSTTAQGIAVAVEGVGVSLSIFGLMSGSESKPLSSVAVDFRSFVRHPDDTDQEQRQSLQWGDPINMTVNHQDESPDLGGEYPIKVNYDGFNELEYGNPDFEDFGTTNPFISASSQPVGSRIDFELLFNANGIIVNGLNSSVHIKSRAAYMHKGHDEDGKGVLRDIKLIPLN
jgi:hypothetical protein